MTEALREVLPDYSILAEKNYTFFRDLTEPDWPDIGLQTFVNYDEILGERVDVKGYNSLLPLINGKDVIQIINESIDHLKPGEKLRILDVGCWTGYALSDCLANKSWQDKISLFGITAQIPSWRKKELEDCGVKIEVGDARHLAEIFRGKKFDLIISSNSLGYMFDSFSVLEQVWELLSEKGKALINGLYWDREGKQDIKKINHFLRRFGFSVVLKEKAIKTNRQTMEEFSYLQAVMEKTEDGGRVLHFPVVPVGRKQHDPKYPTILIYRYGGERELLSNIFGSFFSQAGNRRHAV